MNAETGPLEWTNAPVRMIEIDKLRPPKSPLRKYGVVSRPDIEALARSISELGVLTPLLVHPIADEEGYEIIGGCTRWAAARSAKIELLPCRVYEQNLSFGQARLIALSDNLVRSAHMHPLDIAYGLKEALKEGVYQREDQVGLPVTLSQARVRQFIELTKLPEGVLEIIRSSPAVVHSTDSDGQEVVEWRLSERVLRPLTGMNYSTEYRDKQIEIAQSIFEQQLSARKVKELVDDVLDAGPKTTRKGRSRKQRPVTIPDMPDPSIDMKISPNRFVITIGYAQIEGLHRKLQQVAQIVAQPDFNPTKCLSNQQMQR